MDNTQKIILELNDLPNFKAVFSRPMAELGVTGIDDLRQVLLDEERTSAMISAVKGLGTKTVQIWKNALDAPEGQSVEENIISQPVPEAEAIEMVPSEEETEGSATEEETELSSVDVDTVLARAKVERELFCSMGDLKEIERTTIDLLHMNGSKKKGLLASVEYVAKRLNAAGLEVNVNEDSGTPTIVASKGMGGIVLWGHLDTDRFCGMERKDQGTVRGDIIYGRGAANMKGAVGAMLCAATKLTSWQVPFSIVLTTDALNEQKGAEALAKDPVVRDSKGIIVFAPTAMKPVIGHAGYAAIKVIISGDGAIMNMASFLKMLKGEIDRSSGRLSVKTGMIRGGRRKRPFDPARSCELMMELVTMDTTDSAIEMIEELLVEIEHHVEIMCRSEMTEFDRSSELAKAVTELTRSEPNMEMVHSDAAMIVPVNQKIIIYGPGSMASAVSDQEYVTLSELEKTYEAILNMVDILTPVED
jgi:acetylornithine deacetylase/succinyl-diaminopimelate desuccinylase-like protein